MPRHRRTYFRPTGSTIKICAHFRYANLANRNFFPSKNSESSATSGGMREQGSPSVLAGRFRLEAILGEGGMGTVYRATDLRLEREVAVKVVRPFADSTETAARFVREARRTAQVRHPNVVEVFDVGETAEGDLFLVMELLRGEPLSTRLTREGRVAVDAFASIAVEMCGGLGAAHALGIVHRDVKPANIMLVTHGGRRDLVKVVDFGIAKTERTATALTDADTLLGTLEYISPEQILGEAPLDARSDVYALGLVMYLMLAGTPAFRGVPRSALIHHHLEVEPEPLGHRAPNSAIPPALAAVVMRALAKSPAARYTNASTLRLALEEALSGAIVVHSSLPVPELASAAGARPPQSAFPQETLVDPPARRRDDHLARGAPVPTPPPAELVLELAEAPRTAIMARPSSRVCGMCGAFLAFDGDRCPPCSLRPLSAPPPSSVPAHRGQAPRSIGLPPRDRDLTEPSLGVTPTRLALAVALVCVASAGGLRWLEVESNLVYQQLALVFVVALFVAYLFRRFGRGDGP